MSNVKLNLGIPHSKEECIPRIVKKWFGEIDLAEEQHVKMTVAQLKAMLEDAHQEGRIRQLETHRSILPPLK